jgi:ubiquinone/menaquinone biosynthesis C-methylase UbiE
MLDVARSIPTSAGARIEWREGDASSLPLADRSFDLVMCQQGLQFFPNRPSAVAEMRRVLVTGGRAVVSVWDSLELHPAYKAMFSAVASRVGAPVSAVAAPFSLSDGGEVAALFKAARFSDVKVISHTQEVHFPSPNRFLELSIRGAAAVLPIFAKMTEEARPDMVEAVREEAAPALAKSTRGDILAFPMTSNVVVARA